MSDQAAPLLLSACDPDAIEIAARAIREGRLVALPTETVYGIACALDTPAIQALLEAKRRPEAKGITLMADDIGQVEALAELTAAGRRLAARFWPGPLTLVLRPRTGIALPRVLTGGPGTVGFRIPDHRVPRALARSLGPLPLTSANLSGEPDAMTAAEVLRQVGPALGVVLDDGPSPGGTPSTVVAVFADAPEPILLRAGALSFAELREVAGR